MAGLFSRPDNRAAEQQMAEQVKENAALKEQAMTEKRDIAEQNAARTRARVRGGARTLLSAARLSPETGVPETFGSNTGSVS